MHTAYLDPTQASARALIERHGEGPVTMLNLLRFREQADYSAHPELAPDAPISGQAAYERYMAHTAPLLAASGGRVEYLGAGGAFFIGPEDEHWDWIMLVQQRSVADFLAFAQDPAFQAGHGHRRAALLDSRLLPMRTLSSALGTGS
ncbi:MAG: DUF1330 domain-containing protein [Pseudomonadota bacterium]